MKQTPADKLAALTKKWYEKLRKEGFQDAERNETELYRYSQNAYRDYDVDVNKRQGGTNLINVLEGKEEYYRMAEHFLNEHKFKDTLEKYVWEQHSNGVSARKIATKLKAKKSKKITSTSKSPVDRTIQELKKLMFEKYGVSRGQ